MGVLLWRLGLLPLAADTGADGGADGGAGGEESPKGAADKQKEPDAKAEDAQGANPERQGEDVSGLKATITALRAERDGAKAEAAQLKQQFEGLDPDAARMALEQVPQLQEELQALRLDSTVNGALIRVLPEYRPLVESALRSQLAVGEDGAIAGRGGEAPAALVDTLKAQYPIMFAAEGTVPVGGGTTSSTATQPQQTATVSAPGGIIRGVQPTDVIEGKVKISG